MRKRIFPQAGLVLQMVGILLGVHLLGDVLSDTFLTSTLARWSLTSLLLGGAVWALARYWVRRIQELQEVAQDIAERDFSRRAPIHRNDELGALARAMNRMTDSLQEFFEDLQMKNDYISNLNRDLEVITAQLEEANQHLKETQAQLLQQEKMASVGQLAAGVAHEINNPMGFILSNLNTLSGYLQDLKRLLEAYRELEEALEPLARQDPQWAAHLERLQNLREEVDLAFLLEDLEHLVAESLEGAERVKRIVRDLREFSHVDRAEWEAVDLHQGLESTLNIAWNEIKYKAQVIREYGDLPPVPCYPQQINQVFLNLLLNAVQAIPERGEIRIRTYTRDRWAVVEIQDNGVGIPEEIRSRIFEPFFTTKPVGEGTGLGLSIAYSIIQRHQGRIEVESEPGVGTTFRIWLPLEGHPQDATPREDRAHETSSADRG